jgi:hypothetical protein
MHPHQPLDPVQTAGKTLSQNIVPEPARTIGSITDMKLARILAPNASSLRAWALGARTSQA